MYENHIIPVNDLVPHDENQQCICGPDIEIYDEILVIHHAADGRA